jgi:luciferase family oxidoreductase group 1
MKLSVLDQSTSAVGASPHVAIQETLALARHCDALGYHRYWVAEHHGGPMLAGPSPEALIGPLASATERIRIGSGGVMLPHYSPFKVAETFSVLAGLFPGRIDLGLGRAAGTDPMTTHALQRDRSLALPDDFPQQLTELLAYFEGTVPLSSPLARLAKVLPGRPHVPEPWLLGSSPQSAVWAGELGLPYAFADFINPNGAEIAALYRREFREGVRLDAPRTVVAMWALAADSEQEAERLAASSRMAFTMLRRGRLIEVPPPDEAVRFLEREGDGVGGRRRTVVGTPEQVRAGIEGVAADYGADEVIVVTITHDHEARRRSYELIADAFGLTPAAGADALGGISVP